MDAIDELIAEGLAAATDDRERVWLLASYAISARVRQTASAGEDEPLAPRFAAIREAAEIAERLDDPNLMAVSVDVLGDLHEVDGNYAAAWAAYETQIPILDRIENPAARAGWVHSASQRVLEIGGDPHRAKVLAEQAYELGGRLSAHDRAHGIFGLMAASYWLGEWDRVEELLAEHLANPELAAGARCTSVQSGPSLGALVIAHRGDPQRALDIARRTQTWEVSPGVVEGYLAQALVAAGAVDDGQELATRVLTGARRWRWPEAAQAMIASLVERKAWDPARLFVGEIADLRRGYPLLDGLAERAAGQASAAHDEADSARESMARAMASFDRLPMPFEAARTREALAGISSGAERVVLLEAAVASYRSLGAAPHLARAEALLAKT